ncbi:MAG: PQQ-dependent sugar dehydrogenase, partial [Ignavibacteria bacterium]
MRINLNFLIVLLTVNVFVCGKNETQLIKHEITQKNSDYKVEIFCEDLVVPWSIIFTSEKRVLINERPGRLRVIEDGKLLDKPLKEFNEVSSSSEEGLMGLALDPDYSTNKLIYLSY